MGMARIGGMAGMFRKVSAGMGNDPGIRNQLSARRKALRDKLGGRPVAAVGMGLDSQWGWRKAWRDGYRVSIGAEHTIICG